MDVVTLDLELRCVRGRMQRDVRVDGGLRVGDFLKRAEFGPCPPVTLTDPDLLLAELPPGRRGQPRLVLAVTRLPTWPSGALDFLA
jgi:hypothetical protein